MVVNKEISLAALLLCAIAAPSLAEAGLPQGDDPWFLAAESRLEKVRSARPGPEAARNVILFVGDGMSLSTITAGAIWEGQQKGEPGEGHLLSFEALPYTGLIKTYTTDFQTPDSAGTATAMVTGVKTKSGIISLDDAVQRSACGTGKAVRTIMEIAEEAGLSTGVVTTTRLTHATPAVNYSHSPNRGWENDTRVKAGADGQTCADIASQLIDFPFGDGPEVALGGGRIQFLPKTQKDPENLKLSGLRADGRDLTDEWILSRKDAVYVWNKKAFDRIQPARTSRLLGLFEPSHMNYELDRAEDSAGEPSLSEMTSKAIQILSRNDKGYYLMVEGGRIDHAHHANNAARALAETSALSDAVRTALEMTDPQNTLILVTADHAHTLTIVGYASRGHEILGTVSVEGKPVVAKDGKPYTILTYSNGPGAHRGGERHDVSEVDTTDKDYRQDALVPLNSETHSGEDVAVYGRGPGAQWLSGVYEQNYLFHVMATALGLIGKDETN